MVLDDYTGMSYDDAYNKLSGLGFNVTKREQTSDQPAGTVIDQNLAKGYKVETVLKGLGEYESIRRLFVEHIKTAR